MDYDWPTILDAYGPAVWRILRCLVGHEADARDCYQTVFLEAFQLSRKEPIEEWGKLLHRLARVRALDVLRVRYRTASRFDATASPEDVLSRFPAPEEDAETAELAERLRNGLALLSPQQAEAFVMRFVEQLSYDDIAQRTCSNRNAVGATLHRAREQLRRYLEVDVYSAVKVRRKRHGE